MYTMVCFSSDTPSSSSHPSRNGAWLSFERHTPTPSPPSPSWLTASDPFDPPFITSCAEPDYPHLNLARSNAPQGGHPHLLYADSLKLYPPLSSASSPSKSTLSSQEEPGEFSRSYSTHIPGVLDSPPVMRRRDLASQKPLTPPPTMPHPTLNLPDADLDATFCDQEGEQIDQQFDMDECPPSNPTSPHSLQSSLPLSPLSPSWDPPRQRNLLISSSQDLTESEHSNALFSVCDSSAPLALDYPDPSRLSPHESSSLLEVDLNVDAPHPLLASITLPWHSKEDPEPPSSPPASPSPVALLVDYDELPPPSSPLISRLDLPDFEDDGLPKIVPSSPSRRSFTGLPDSDAEMSDSTCDPVVTLPGQPLLSLPGADIDDDLIPRVAPTLHPIPHTPSQSLLFIDDPRDVPLPRSPSPEDFDLCFSQEEITDPELAKLFDLRKRSVAAERAARRLEMLTEDVDLFTRAEARKIRKRERERSKEVGALLRLKLGDGITMCSPQEQSSPPPEGDLQNHARRRGVISNMSQLVAQMVFRRNETSRPLAKRKMANVAREYVRSALKDDATATD